MCAPPHWLCSLRNCFSSVFISCSSTLITHSIPYLDRIFNQPPNPLLQEYQVADGSFTSFLHMIWLIGVSKLLVLPHELPLSMNLGCDSLLPSSKFDMYVDARCQAEALSTTSIYRRQLPTIANMLKKATCNLRSCGIAISATSFKEAPSFIYQAQYRCHTCQPPSLFFESTRTMMRTNHAYCRGRSNKVPMLFLLLMIQTQPMCPLDLSNTSSQVYSSPTKL